MSIVSKYFKKRYIILFLLLLLLLKLFISPPDIYEDDIGLLALAVSNVSVFHYKTPAKGTLVFTLNFANNSSETSINSNNIENNQLAHTNNQRLDLCARYGNGLSTLEGRINNYRCTSAFIAGIHHSKLYDEITGTLLSENYFPNGMGGFKLLIINGLPKGRSVRLEVETQAFDDLENELASAIREVTTDPLPKINIGKTAVVQATLRPWTDDIQRNIPDAVKRLTAN